MLVRPGDSRTRRNAESRTEDDYSCYFQYGRPEGKEKCDRSVQPGQNEPGSRCSTILKQYLRVSNEKHGGKGPILTPRDLRLKPGEILVQIVGGKQSFLSKKESARVSPQNNALGQQRETPRNKAKLRQLVSVQEIQASKRPTSTEETERPHKLEPMSARGAEAGGKVRRKLEFDRPQSTARVLSVRCHLLAPHKFQFEPKLSPQAATDRTGLATEDSARPEESGTLGLPDDSNYIRMVSFMEDLKLTMKGSGSPRKTPASDSKMGKSRSLKFIPRSSDASETSGDIMSAWPDNSPTPTLINSARSNTRTEAIPSVPEAAARSHHRAAESLLHLHPDRRENLALRLNLRLQKLIGLKKNTKTKKPPVLRLKARPGPTVVAENDSQGEEVVPLLDKLNRLQNGNRQRGAYATADNEREKRGRTKRIRKDKTMVLVPTLGSTPLLSPPRLAVDDVMYVFPGRFVDNPII